MALSVVVVLGILAAADAPGAPIRGAAESREPRKLEGVAPEYPPAARRAGLAGVVVLECTVDPRGRVTRAVPVRGVPPLTEAAAAAVRKWRYEPAVVDGAAVPVTFTVTWTFSADGLSVTLDDLLVSLVNRNEHIRLAAATNLGKLAPSGFEPADVQRAVQALQPLAAWDVSAGVRAAALRSLQRLGGRPVVTTPAVDTTPPEAVERRQAAWGTFVGSAGSVLEQVGERIAISVPAGHRDLAVETGPLAASRLLKPVTGSFEAEVRVDPVPEPGPPLSLASFRAAGILLWQDERNYVRLESAVYRLRLPLVLWLKDRQPGDVRYALFELRRDGEPVGGIDPADVRLEAGPAELRLQRGGRKIVGLVRQGGRGWRKVGDIETDLADSLEVGFAAISIAFSELRAGFEGFRVTPR